MGRKSIKSSSKTELLVRSGGRCALCNIYLFLDTKTQREVHYHEFAHNAPHSPIGPRHQDIPSEPIEKDNINNLVVLCPTCHSLVDTDTEFYNFEYFQKIKTEHEARILKLTGLRQDDEILPVIYNSNIGIQQIKFSQSEYRDAILQFGFFPASSYIDLSSVNSIADNDPNYYIEKVRDLNNQIILQSDNIRNHRIGVFALAPQPLLIYLGTKLHNTLSAILFQRMRTTQNWVWDKNTTSKNFKILIPENIYLQNEICVKFEISDIIDDKRVKEIVPNSDIWTIRASSPSLFFMSSYSQLQEFSKLVADLFSQIKEVYEKDKYVHIFPVMPNSLAVELGRVWMPKIFHSMMIYDHRKQPDIGFHKCLKIE